MLAIPRLSFLNADVTFPPSADQAVAFTQRTCPAEDSSTGRQPGKFLERSGKHTWGSFQQKGHWWTGDRALVTAGVRNPDGSHVSAVQVKVNASGHFLGVAAPSEPLSWPTDDLPKADPRILLWLHHYMTCSKAECMLKELDGKKGIAAFGGKTIWRSFSSALMCKKWVEVCTLADQALVQHSSVIDQQLVNMFGQKVLLDIGKERKRLRQVVMLVVGSNMTGVPTRLRSSVAVAGCWTWSPMNLAPSDAMHDLGIGVLVTLRYEGPYLLPWLTHHRLLGARQIWVYLDERLPNSSVEEHTGLVDAMQQQSWIAVVRMKEHGLVDQGQMGTHCRRLTEAKVHWLGIWDVDEILAIGGGVENSSRTDVPVPSFVDYLGSTLPQVMLCTIWEFVCFRPRMAIFCRKMA